MPNSLDHGLEVLEFLADQDQARLVEVASHLGVSRATAFRVITCLESHRYVEHDRVGHVFRLGPGVHALAARSAATSVERLAAPAMASLRESTSETVNLALLSRGRICYAAIIDGAFALRMLANVGDEVPAHATAIGKAISASVPASERSALLGPDPYPSFTDRTICSAQVLKAELSRVRSEGFAIDDGEMEVGAACVAAPILGRDGHPVGAISVSGLAERMPAATRPELGRMIRHWCDSISGQLGYTGLGRQAGG
jgi:IclR family acetate operon transcriptional repressor